MQATPLQSSTGADATNTETPRVEAQLDYNFKHQDLGGYIWVDGQYQNVSRTEAEASAFNGLVGGQYWSSKMLKWKQLVNMDEFIDVGGIGFGTRLTFQGLKFVALVSTMWSWNAVPR